VRRPRKNQRVLVEAITWLPDDVHRVLIGDCSGVASTASLRATRNIHIDPPLLSVLGVSAAVTA
jgi:hypothetical protein